MKTFEFTFADMEDVFDRLLKIRREAEVVVHNRLVAPDVARERHHKLLFEIGAVDQWVPLVPKPKLDVELLSRADATQAALHTSLHAAIAVSKSIAHTAAAARRSLVGHEDELAKRVAAAKLLAGVGEEIAQAAAAYAERSHNPPAAVISKQVADLAREALEFAESLVKGGEK